MCASVYLLVFIRILLVHLAEKILLLKPLNFGGDYPNGHHIELAGELAGILALGDAQTTRPAASAGLKSVTVVAGVGFEPTTFRL
ncbi:hypothetical protein ACSSV8_003977 [Roseovarius sp. MBR-79]